ncbi:UNVERIFIED_CONTAM: hypothetical protein GTU68_004185 [Idotea baltica]|nr:hypothetical protein [Idotea baltica]
MVIHHILMVGLFFPILVKCVSMGNFIAGCFFLMELSSIFVNLRFILSKIGMKRSTLYLINGIFMMATFALCRVLIFPFMYFCYLYQQSYMLKLSYTETFLKVPVVCHLSSILIMIPQIYWLSNIIKGAKGSLAIDKTDEKHL